MKTAAKPFSVESKEVSGPGREIVGIIAASGAHVKKNFEEKLSWKIHSCPSCDRLTFGMDLPKGGHVDICPNCYFERLENFCLNEAKKRACGF